MAALAVDPSGARVLTGSYDYTVRMYDFGGMDSRLKAFRELTPFDGHQVRALTWSPTGDMFFAATGNAQAKVKKANMVPTFRSKVHLRAPGCFLRCHWERPVRGEDSKTRA